MKKLLKGVSLVLMICMLCCTMSVFASAQLVPEITPFWVNIDSITLTITFNNLPAVNTAGNPKINFHEAYIK